VIAPASHAAFADGTRGDEADGAAARELLERLLGRAHGLVRDPEQVLVERNAPRHGARVENRNRASLGPSSVIADRRTVLFVRTLERAGQNADAVEQER
jgi:hypothetical protein